MSNDIKYLCAGCGDHYSEPHGGRTLGRDYYCLWCLDRAVDRLKDSLAEARDALEECASALELCRDEPDVLDHAQDAARSAIAKADAVLGTRGETA
ncbi:MAG: hypothetical protein QJR08_03650 [Bacillota bacterium]|nr:hypothetical protein [Bacillota bacterium]